MGQPERWIDGGASRAHLQQLRREVILRTAARCFNRQGYATTTMADIARELGVSKAALYRYVESKEQVLHDCHAAALDIAMEGIRRAEAAGGNAASRLTLALQHFVEGLTAQLNGCIVLLEGMLDSRRQSDLIRRRDEYEGCLRRLVAEGVAEGVFAPCDAKLTVLAILGAMNWIPRWYSPDGGRTPHEIAEHFATYLVRGLLAAPAAAPTGRR